MESHDCLNRDERLRKKFEISGQTLFAVVRQRLTPFCTGPSGCSLIIGRGSRPRFGMGEKNFVAMSASSSNDSGKSVRTGRIVQNREADLSLLSIASSDWRSTLYSTTQLGGDEPHDQRSHRQIRFRCW